MAVIRLILPLIAGLLCLLAVTAEKKVPAKRK